LNYTAKISVSLLATLVLSCISRVDWLILSLVDKFLIRTYKFMIYILTIFSEILEFDAMDDPPSVMDVHVYDFDGLLKKQLS
jgi:hypothetical protein